VQEKVFWINAFLVLLLMLLIGCTLILSCVPPVSKDALVHHLAVPKLYLKHGGIYEIPSMEFSYYPMNLDLLYMIPLYFKNDIAPKYIHFGFAMLTSWLIFIYLRRRINTVYGLLGVIFFISIPIIIKLSITVYVDLGVIFFSTASLLLILKWIESGFRVRFLILSGVLCGLALGTKYNGLVIFFLLTLFVPFLYSRYTQREKPGFIRPMGYGMLFLVIVLFVFSPWMIRNYHWKKNPIYPLYNSWFNPPKATSGKVVSGDAAKNPNRGFFTFRSMVYHETWWQIALLPVRVFFQGKDGDPQYFDGKLNPFLLLLPIFAFYRMREDPYNVGKEKKVILAFAILFFGFAFFSIVMRIRYISPIIPPLVILSVFGVKNMIGIVDRFGKKNTRQAGLAVVCMILTFFFALNVDYIIDQFRYVAPFTYIKGTMSRDEYIERYRPEYPAMRYINKNLPSDALILFIFLGKRGYYCDRRYMLGEGQLVHIIRKSNHSQEILLGLKNLGITHLLINNSFFDRWVKDNFEQKKRELLKEFFNRHVKVLFLKSGYGLGRLEYLSS